MLQPIGGTADGEIPAEIRSTKAADGPLPACERDKKTMVFAEEQIEAPISSAQADDRCEPVVAVPPPFPAS